MPRTCSHIYWIYVFFLQSFFILAEEILECLSGALMANFAK
jgi:hypothetical protein